MGADHRRAVGLRDVLAVVALALAANLAPAAPVAAHEGGVAAYRWADGSGAGRAEGRAADLPAGEPTELWTPDGQAVVSLPATALDGPAGSTVRADLRPVDAATLGPLPDGLAAAGNAYRVDLELTAPGTILLGAAHPATGVLRSDDGRGWQRVASDEVLGGLITAPLERSGWFLVVTDAGHGSSPLAASAVAASLGLALLGVGVLRRGRRDRRPSADGPALT